MILYHYTAIELLAAIEREGLTKGEIPITETHLENGVWFTTDPSPAGHGLTDGGTVGAQEHAEIERLAGKKLPPLHRTDKRRVRISVILPSHDRKLKEWLRYAKSRLEARWLSALTDAGGGRQKAETWRLYLGAIPPERFRLIEVRGLDGSYHPITAEDRAEAQEKAVKADQAFTMPVALT